MTKADAAMAIYSNYLCAAVSALENASPVIERHAAGAFIT
jgi:hypothetical protein